MSAIMTVHFTTRSIDEPVRCSTSLMFSSVCRVSASMPPGTSVPADASGVPIWPERYSMFPTRTAGENGRVGGPYGVRYWAPADGAVSGRLRPPQAAVAARMRQTGRQTGQRTRMTPPGVGKREKYERQDSGAISYGYRLPVGGGTRSALPLPASALQSWQADCQTERLTAPNFAILANKLGYAGCFSVRPRNGRTTGGR